MKIKEILVRGSTNYRHEFLLECFKAFEEGFVPHPTESKYAARAVGNYGISVTLVKYENNEPKPDTIRDQGTAIEVSEDVARSPEQEAKDKVLGELSEKLNDPKLSKPEIYQIAEEYEVEIPEDIKYPAQMRKLLRETLLNEDETKEEDNQDK